MKKFFSFILAGAAAALALSSCQKEVAPAEPEATVKTVNFNAIAPSTKAVLGEKDGTSYPTTWSANDTKVKISLNYGSALDASMTPSSDGSSASISADIEEPATAPETYTFYALSPAAAYLSISSNYENWGITIPTTQTPGTKTPDENAMILAAKSEAFEAMPTASVNLSFSHVTAYLDFSILNLKEGVTVESIDLTFGTNVAGRWYYKPSDGSMSVNSGATSINLATSATENLFVGLAPVDASVLGGTQLKVTVNASNETKFVKTVTLPTSAAFVAGKVNTLKVDFTGIESSEAEVYTKVTSYDELTAGSKVIIAAAGTTAYAISTTQNNNNRAQASVTKSEDGSQIIGPSDAVEIFTLEAGTAENTVAFLATAGYIYGAGSTTNYMRTHENKDEASSFTVSFDEDIVTLVTKGTQQTMKYNSTNTNPGPIFSCYKEGSSVITAEGNDISLYKLAGTGSGDPLVAAPVEYSITIGTTENGTVTASAATAHEGDEITLTVTPSEGYKLDVLTVTNATTSETVEVTNNKFTMPASDVNVSATFVVNTSGVPDPETIVFADLGLENSVQYTDPFDGGNFTVTFAGGSNDGKYYNTGAAIRVYAGGTFTVSSTEYNIIQIDLTFGSGDGSNAITTNVESFTSPTWTGSSKSVVFSVGGTSGHRRIASIKVTYGN